MRHHDDDEAARMGAEPWMLELLAANPSYLGWGPHEDYMIVRGDGWNSPQTYASWSDFGPWRLDDLNECVNFYFSVNRKAEDCAACGGDGYHPSAHRIVNSFYKHMAAGIGLSESEAWHDKITQDEVQALVDAGRLMDFTHEFVAGEGWKPKVPAAVPTAAEVNAWERGRGIGHDCINRHILTQQRIKRELGLQDHRCPSCEGHGYIYTAPAPHVTLTLWWLHPRKGCSRGIEVNNIQRKELPAVQRFLKEAAQRNADRFTGINLIA